MTHESMPEHGQEKAAREAREKYEHAYELARTREERRQALEALLKSVPHVKKIETFEQGLAKIVELENELQKAKEQLSDAKTHRWMLVNLLRLIFVLYASCTCPGGWLLGLLLGTLLVVIGWAMWRTAERNSW